MKRGFTYFIEEDLDKWLETRAKELNNTKSRILNAILEKLKENRK